MSENEMILAGGADLVKQSELYEPMLYYGSKARITVDYGYSSAASCSIF